VVRSVVEPVIEKPLRRKRINRRQRRSATIIRSLPGAARIFILAKEVRELRPPELGPLIAGRPTRLAATLRAEIPNGGG